MIKSVLMIIAICPLITSCTVPNYAYSTRPMDVYQNKPNSSRTASIKEDRRDYCHTEYETALSANMALGISTYKGDFYISKKASIRALTIRVYRGGELIKSIDSYGGMTRKTSLGSGAFALHIIDNSKLKLDGHDSGFTLSLGWVMDDVRNSTSIHLETSDINFTPSNIYGAFPKFEVKDGAIPLFCIFPAKSRTPPIVDVDTVVNYFKKSHVYIIVGCIKIDD